MIHHPGNEGQGYKELEFYRVFHVHQQDVHRADRHGDDAQKTLVIEQEGHRNGCGDQKDFPEGVQPVLVAQIIPVAGEHIAHRSGDTAQQKHADCLHQQLQGLNQENPGFLFDGAGTDLNESSKKVYDICGNNCHNESPLADGFGGTACPNYKRFTHTSQVKKPWNPRIPWLGKFSIDSFEHQGGILLHIS